MNNNITSKVRLALAALVPLFFSILFLVRFVNHSDEKDYKEEIQKNSELLKNGVETNVKFADSFSEFKRRNDKFYIADFTYVVNNKEYKESISAATEEQLYEEIQDKTLVYNPKNPEVYSFNPQKDLDYYKNLLKNNSKQNDSPWFFIILLLASIGVIIYSVLGIKKIKNEQKEMQNFRAKMNQ